MKDIKNKYYILLVTLRNIALPFLLLLVVYAFFNNLFLVSILNPVTYLDNKAQLDIFFKNYINATLYNIIPIIIISATITVLLIASIRLYRYKLAVISIFIFTVIIGIYPVYNVYKREINKIDFRKYNPQSSRTGAYFLYDIVIKTNTITSINNYSLYVKKSDGNNRYKNIVLNKMGIKEPLYIANNILIEEGSLLLEDVIIMNSKDEKIEKKAGVNIKFFNVNAINDFSVSISGVFMLEYINAIIYKFIDNDKPLMFFIILFISFFIFLLSGYMFISSISSPIHKMHNILSVVLLYYIFTNILYHYSKVYNFISIIESTSILKMSFFFFVYNIIVMLISILLKYLFNFNKYYATIEKV